MIRRMFAGASAHVFNIFYKATRKRKRGDEVVFLSRRTDGPSYDFAELANEFSRRGWRVTMHLKKVTGKTMIPYAFHVLKEIKLLGRCKIAVLDRYDPVVSLLNFECEGGEPKGEVRTGSEQAPCNVEFPRKPVILQMWHAFGAYKKFGYQSVDTPEGHSESFTSTFSIHRNYSWVMCSGEGARAAFAEAFSCPIERVVALDRPEYDELASLAESRKRQPREARRFTVLMAPTLRINKDSEHPFRDLYQVRDVFEREVDAEFVWSFHPLEEKLPAPGNVSEELLSCDCVVTDYSSLVYEAYLLGIPVLFYIPDIESYRVSPGLNVDPSSTSPGLCARTQQELAEKLRSLCLDSGSYDADALERFAGSAFAIDGDRESGTAASRLADFLIAHCR